MNPPYLCFNPIHMLNPGMRRIRVPRLDFDHTLRWEIDYDTYHISTIDLKNPAQIESYLQKLNLVIPKYTYQKSHTRTKRL